jgi:hypothetical protein
VRTISRGLSICLPVLAGIVLASCTASPIGIEIGDIGGQTFVTLFTTTFFGRHSDEIPCIRTITVSSFDATHQAAPVWSAAAGGDPQWVAPGDPGCIRIRSFAIGRAPPGFAETMHLAAGVMRGRYKVEVEGVGRGEHDITF